MGINHGLDQRFRQLNMVVQSLPQTQGGSKWRNKPPLAVRSKNDFALQLLLGKVCTKSHYSQNKNNSTKQGHILERTAKSQTNYLIVLFFQFEFSLRVIKLPFSSNSLFYFLAFAFMIIVKQSMTSLMLVRKNAFKIIRHRAFKNFFTTYKRKCPNS